MPIFSIIIASFFPSKVTLISRRQQQSHFSCDCSCESSRKKQYRETILFKEKKNLYSTAAIYNHFSIIPIALFFNILIRRISFKCKIRFVCLTHTRNYCDELDTKKFQANFEKKIVWLRIFSGFFLPSLSFVTKCMEKPASITIEICICSCFSFASKIVVNFQKSFSIYFFSSNQVSSWTLNEGTERKPFVPMVAFASLTHKWNNKKCSGIDFQEFFFAELVVMFERDFPENYTKFPKNINSPS